MTWSNNKKILLISVENITYLCTKVNIENDTAVSQGCFKQLKNGHELELCVCESSAGDLPCNHGKIFNSHCISFMLILLSTFCFVFASYINSF